ncbi:lysoplasmalogenase [Agromyces sp. Marseille-P2726]|uniref:lysoplasmalogenase n=1 Tax=Agromyces sp. Marseille-P2726 TaxID=2709132 RepID=UPI00156EDE0B|nr:lysoplasmalogenase [Agromyces sp. Marseille-P2726]
MRSSRERTMVRAFAPYVVLSVAHLVLQQTGPVWAVTATKALLMPLLALAVVIVARPLTATVRVLLLAIAFSWAGDVALSLPGSAAFVVGLGCFLLAHVGYIAAFLRMSRTRRLPPAWTLVYVAWYAVFLALLGPHTGVLLAPVALYGLVLAAMAAASAWHGPLVAAGGALFVLSDSVLGSGRFLPGYDFPLHDLVVMASYLMAQAFIAAGVLRTLRTERW